MKNKKGNIVQLTLLTGAFFLSLILLAFYIGQNSQTATAGSAEDRLSYLPIIQRGPDPTPIPPIPQFVENISLPNVQCPNSVGFNATSGYIYVVNNFSSNISAFKNSQFITNIPVGTWPTSIATYNDSSLIYVTALHSGTVLIDGTTKLGTITPKYEPYGVALNPVNGFAYITDLDSAVQIVDGLSEIAKITITDPEISPPDNGAGWLQPVVVDPNTGLVYVASWSHGKMYVLDGTTVVANYRAGWGIKDMVIDASRGYIYLAHSEPNATYPHNISVFNIATKTFTYINTNQGSQSGSRAVTVDPISGYAYFTNPGQDNVTVLQGTNVVATLPAGDTPWGIGVNPNTGYVFVTNRTSNNITVIKELSVVKTIPAQGLQPFAVGVDTLTNDVYIANRGDEYGLFQCRDASVTILR